jgi:hypothetical protein
MRYNAKLHGKILTYDSVQIRGGAKHPVAECIPELRGHVAVPVEASCLVFAPTVGSIVFVDVSRVALKGTVIGHILAQATVRFDAEALFGKFMHVSANRWRYGEFTLQARDVVSARVVRVGQEDESGLLMTCEVEPADEMIVLSSDGKRTVLKPLSPAAITAAVAAASSAAAALNSAVKSGSRKSTGGSGKKVRLIE